MKTTSLYLISIFILSFFALSCQEAQKKQEAPLRLSDNFKNYWYNGTAEISTYTLNQNRYGELRKGTATLIYVTEDFLPQQQVKANNQDANNIPVLKLNSTKKFNTGVYPYSIMQSSFFPLQKENQHALKLTASIQEWCGHTYLQLNNKSNFEITGHSYFASEGDQHLNIDKIILENEIWNSIRVNGEKSIPIGHFKILPSLEFLRLNHKEIKSYEVIAELKSNNGISNYTLTYPELKRKLQINFTSTAPFIIESWSEKIDLKPATTAKRITTKRLPYWKQNSNTFEPLRNELGLH